MPLPLADHLHESARLIAAMAGFAAAPQVDRAVEKIVHAFRHHKPLLVCGNGGSASDACHIAGELVGRFLKERQALKCLALTSDPAVLTALGNDMGYDNVFARQVEAFAEPGGILLGLSTSGNSANVIAAFKTAKLRDMTTIAMTGEGGGALALHSDILIDVPSKHTPYIQQIHLCLYHYICEAVEAAFVDQRGG
jgi:D-sedoheptulose 7-phosphate isomerase